MLKPRPVPLRKSLFVTKKFKYAFLYFGGYALAIIGDLDIAVIPVGADFNTYLAVDGLCGVDEHGHKSLVKFTGIAEYVGNRAEVIHQRGFLW